MTHTARPTDRIAPDSRHAQWSVARACAALATLTAALFPRRAR